MLSFRKSEPIVNINNFLHRFAIVSLFTLIWSIPAFSGEIHDAAIKGDLAKVKSLLEKNPELVSSKDKDGFTPLFVSHKDVVELLLAKGADVNSKDNNGNRPLHWAAEMGCEDVVKLLLANGADVNARDYNGFTPLHWARPPIAELLRQNGGHE
jgi:ankyrin repeat protein